MKLAISDLDHVSHQIEADILSAAGLPFELLDCKSEEDLIAQLQGVEVVLNQYAPFTKRVFSSLPDLRLIVRYGVGLNHIDLEAAAAAGVAVCNVPDYGMNEVSDHAVALSLALVRKLVPMDASTHAGRWDYSEAIPIRRQSQMTVGVVGIGRIGSLYAQKMHALGFRVVAFDPDRDRSRALGEAIEMVTFDELLGQSDVISIHCPLSSNTRNLFDDFALRRMKSGAYIVNTARGGLIDEDALADALREQRLGGAGLDTLALEPMRMESPLRGLDRCILTPHMAWYSEDAALELKCKVAEEAVRYARGEKLYWVANKR
jgi:D-3-phosphoglycerate dehydrogenase